MYHGQLELGDSSRAAGVRTVVSAACSHTLTDCLSYMGFMSAFYFVTKFFFPLCCCLCVDGVFPFHSRPVGELVLKGQVFRKGGVKVLVFTMYQVRKGLISSSWFSDLFLMIFLMGIEFI